MAKTVFRKEKFVSPSYELVQGKRSCYTHSMGQRGLSQGHAEVQSCYSDVFHLQALLS